MNFMERIRARLVNEGRAAWALWSVRLAALAGALSAAIVAAPGLLLGLMAYVPEGWRPVAAAVTGVVVFAIPTVTRLWKQEKKDG